jgi:hypothetical protein
MTCHLPSGRLSVAGQKHKVLLQRCFATRNRAFARDCAQCAENLLFFIAVERASRRASPVRTKPRQEEWLSSPDRAHQDLSMCLVHRETPPARAIFERTRARNAISSPALRSSCWRARPVRTKPRPREWLSLPAKAATAAAPASRKDSSGRQH